MTARQAQMAYARAHVRMHCVGLISNWSDRDILEAFAILPPAHVSLPEWIANAGYSIETEAQAARPDDPTEAEQERQNAAALVALQAIKAGNEAATGSSIIDIKES